MNSSINNLYVNKPINFYKKGQALFNQGNPSYGLFCVNNGKVKVSQVGSDGKETILKIASTGDILGYQSLFCEETYHTTASVIEDAGIYLIEKKHLYERLQREPEIAINIIQKLSRDMDQIENMSISRTHKMCRKNWQNFY